jgi:hypothetical protein
MFYKRMDAFHTQEVFTETIAGVPYEARRTIMGDGKAEYFGMEFSFNQRLGALARELADWSVFGNYNYTWSSGELNGREVVLTNSPRHIANLSLLYDNSALGLSFVVSGNFKDATLVGLGGNQYTDLYRSTEVHLDVTVTKTITSRLSVTGQFNGLTSQPHEEVRGNPHESYSRLQSRENYGPYGTASLQYLLW